MFYVRQIVRTTNEEINAVRRELARLLKIGFVKAEARANRLYYSLRSDFIYYSELVRLMGKSENLGGLILENANRLGKIKYAALAAAFIKGREAAAKDVDLLLVGKVDTELLKRLVRETEKKHEHEINYTVMTEDEFNFRKKRQDPFIRQVLSQPQIVLIGDEEELNKW